MVTVFGHYGVLKIGEQVTQQEKKNFTVNWSNRNGGENRPKKRKITTTT